MIREREPAAVESTVRRTAEPDVPAAEASRRATARPLIHLQRTIGNRAVVRAVEGARAERQAEQPRSPGVDRYAVELKAWIPHAEVADPEEPARASNWLDTISTVANAPLRYEYSSRYRGDAHTGYDGSYRVLSRLDFDWDGVAISRPAHRGSYGTTHRDYSYRAWLTLPPVELARGSGTQSATATRAASGTAAGRTLSLDLASANPLVMTWAPDIDSRLTAGFTGASELTVAYLTDRFPSHGFRVIRNGVAVATEVVNDASGVPALGPVGAAAIGHRLTSQTNAGTRRIALP